MEGLSCEIDSYRRAVVMRQSSCILAAPGKRFDQGTCETTCQLYLRPYAKFRSLFLRSVPIHKGICLAFPKISSVRTIQVVPLPAVVQVQTFMHPTGAYFCMHLSNYFPLQPLEQAREGTCYPRLPCPTQLQNNWSTTTMTILRQVPVVALSRVADHSACIRSHYAKAYGLRGQVLARYGN